VERGAVKSWTATTLVFCTSAAVLVIEILAGRLVAPYLGVSLETYTGIIGTILAGIALGSAVGGRMADRIDPRNLLGPTLVLGGGLALLSLPVVTVVGPGAAGGGPVAIVMLTAIAFLAPATVLSAVGPMVAKLRLASLGDTGSVVGGLSAAGTAGALVGTFLTGFVLVAAIPTRPIVLTLGVALSVSGLAMWVRLASGRPGAGVVVGVLVAGLLGVAITGPCQHETAYFCANVEVDDGRPSGRTLVLDNLRHSYVDLDDPTHLEFRYIRLIADVIDGELPGGEPVEALHVGGGGFTVPRWLAATRPGSTNVVLELDPALVEINREELGLETDADLRVVTGDARTAIDDLPTDGFDAVVGDAFGGLSVPWHLTTVEVMAELERVVRPDGVYVANIIDGGPRRFLRAQLATLAEVFDHVALIEPAETDRVVAANHIVVASDAPLQPDSWPVDPADGRIVPSGELTGMVDDVRILTDDFAPVDQLITRR
jgi:SAM-dependent methyltransferase